jgi:hypothetical protein
MGDTLADDDNHHSTAAGRPLVAILTRPGPAECCNSRLLLWHLFWLVPGPEMGVDT